MNTPYIILLSLIIVIIANTLYLNRAVPIISDVSIINLETSKDRWAIISSDLYKFRPLTIIKWKGVYGKDLSEDDLIREGIPHRMYAPGYKDYDHSEKYKRGVIGCYLSHKKLLQYLNTLDVNPGAGHLILEDDINIEPHILSHWRSVEQNLDPTWDIVYFGINPNYVRGEDKHGFRKAISDGMGTYAYMIKHSSIPSLLKEIETINAPIDVMYSNSFQRLNCYVLSDIMVKPKPETKSTIK